MITLTKSGNAIVFTFDDNDHYLNDGKIEVPVNSLTLVTDESQMATFRKSASNDIFISARYDELGMSKADLESWFKENACGSTGGGGVTPEDVEDMISEATSGLAESSAVTEEISAAVSGKADTSAVTQSINAAVSGKANTSDVQNVASDVATVSGDVNTLSGSVNSNHNAITALNGDVSSLSGQVETDEKVTATALVDLDNRKLDASAYTPTDLSNYYTKSQTNTQINNATEGLLNASTFNTYSANTNARLAEDEEVTSAALNELNEAVSGKQDTLIAGSGITIDSANTISCTVEGGGKAIVAGRGIAITTGATADTVSFDLPIWNPSGAHKNIAMGSDTNHPNGMSSVAVGQANTTNQARCFVSGQYNTLNNENEGGFGQYNVSNTGASTSAQTLFSVGNGTSINARHNAFEIRKNGDIYITSGGTDIKLQDNLGGGGLPESAFTAYTAATEARLAEDEEVTAAALTTLDETKADASDLGGLKLVSISQADYDLLPVKDQNTLYIITNVVN